MTEDKDRLHVLQVTDCHLLPSPDATLLGVCTADSLAAVLDAACTERTPDAVLATGDIAQLPSPATYELFLATLARYYTGPLLCVPGNHDHGATLSGTLPTEDLEFDAWRIAGVDTHEDDVVGGTVHESELSRLRATLHGCAAHQHSLVAGHHCPVEIGCSWLDVHRIDNGDDLLDVLRGADARGYVFGHIHQEVEADPGVPIFGTPSTCFQFADDSPNFGFDTAKPGYRWLTLEQDGSIETVVRRVDDYELNLDLNDRANR
ncbi:MAG: metallophosphoesterase [Gammaproteobacteria bacterium]|nr:metallophosphoesterase [Gammaproteobacteria bacterium]